VVRIAATCSTLAAIESNAAVRLGCSALGGVRGERKPVGEPLEQLKTKPGFEQPHHAAHRRLRDVQLLARAHEASVARCGLEGAQTIQRRQAAHG
jgi:hypothetical protein